MPNFDNLSNSSEKQPKTKFSKFKDNNTKYNIQGIFMVILFVGLL